MLQLQIELVSVFTSVHCLLFIGMGVSRQFHTQNLACRFVETFTYQFCRKGLKVPCEYCNMKTVEGHVPNDLCLESDAVRVMFKKLILLLVTIDLNYFTNYLFYKLSS